MTQYNRWLFFVCVFCVFPAYGADDIPEVLKPWSQWVLDGEEYRQCPFFANNAELTENSYICVWPGVLELNASKKGGRFSQNWQVYDETWVQLPGIDAIWPKNVTVDGTPTATVMRGGFPNVRLKPGSHRLRGEFEWAKRPEQLSIPRQTGLLDLTVEGETVRWPRRLAQSVWLGEPPRDESREESIELVVYRLLEDGVPQKLHTQLQLQISGPSREETFTGAILDQFVPMTLSSPLPARIEPDGRLRVQVRPGSWVINITTRATKPLETFSFKVDESWVVQEIWSYAADNRLRVTALSGVEAVDPDQVNVPFSLQIPAYRLKPDDVASLTQRSRGTTENQGNDLTLNRSIWLDFDHRGYTAQDTVAGRMREGWRMDMQDPFVLMSAISHGENLLITRGNEEGLTGVELRKSMVNLQAVSRLEDSVYSIPATGWSNRFDQVNAVLNLPPGHKLIAAFGSDYAPNAWLNRWELLDFFVLLIVAVAASRILNKYYGAIALIMLFLIYREANAPVWIWLNVLIAMALVNAASEGRLRRWLITYRNLSFLSLLILVVPFLANQLKLTLYPQLESRSASSSFSQMGRQKKAMLGFEDALEPPKSGVMSPALKEAAMDSIGVTANRYKAERYAENTLVQAGPGLPSWRWQTYSLGWSSPVEPSQTVRLVILSPWAVALYRLIGVALVGVFLWGLIRGTFELKPLSLSAKTTSLLLIPMILFIVSPNESQAEEIPNAELLAELKTRLLEPPECVPRCAEISYANIKVTESRLEILLSIEVLANSAVALPGRVSGWEAAQVTVDGRRVNRLFRGRQQRLFLEMQPGLHKVQLTGQLPPTDSVQIPFPQPPHRIEVTVDGWEIAGIVQQRLLSGTLELVRVKSDEGGQVTRLSSDRLPTFVKLVRSLEFGLEWEIETTVTRQAPEKGAFTVTLPLLEGESVLTQGLEVRQGKILVAMQAGQSTLSWRSRLERKSPVILTAGGDYYSEVWRLLVGPMWNVSHAGLPTVSTQAADWVPEFYPWPGESLSLEVGRPEATVGNTLAIDGVSLTSVVGKRSSDSNMKLQYRSTRGGQHTITLPVNATTVKLSVDGQDVPVTPQEGSVVMPLLPGAHQLYLTWRDAIGVTGRYTSPIVDLQSPGSNLNLTTELQRNRWVLFTTGPKWGPAILYWSELLVFLIIGFLLGKTTLTPLKTWHWVLLGLGFSTFSWSILFLIGAWLFVMGWRNSHGNPANHRIMYNSIQTMLVFFTIVVMLSLVTAVAFKALLGHPNMQIAGMNSYANHFNWFQDQTLGVLPQTTVISVPIWFYKAAILLWSLWLSLALVNWLPWAWQAINEGGFWRGKVIQSPQISES